MSVSILVVDDEPDVALLFRQRFRREVREGTYVMHFANSGEMALEQLAEGIEPTLIVILSDINMPGMDGLQVQAEMTARGYNLPVIVLTGHGDISTAVRAMQGGAIDFLEKPFNRERLLQALENGFARLGDREGARKREDWARTEVAKLTEREREVLEGLACGYPNKTIAYDLGISSRTVEVYRANVMTKFAVSNFADALRVAFAAG